MPVEPYQAVENYRDEIYVMLVQSMGNRRREFKARKDGKFVHHDIARWTEVIRRILPID
jgi:hypothetical protein